MRIAKNLFKFSTLINRKIPLQSNKTLRFAIGSGFILGSGFLFGNKKILKEEMLTFQTEDNLKEGQFKEIQVGPKIQDTVLISKFQGKIYCTQSKCSHFGFSLAKGVLIGDKIICPLHNAGFDIKTGKPDQGPVFNGLKTFDVQVSGGKIKIRIPKEGWEQAPPVFQMDLSKLNKNKKIVIIGAGSAALSAVDTLRQTGYDGLIYMVTKEKYGPYDRTLLSKMSDAVQKPGQIRTREYFQKNGIILVPESNVIGIDYQNKKVKIQSKESLPYDKLLIASGCVNVKPNIKGLDTVGYNTLRNLNDYEAINKAVRQNGAKNVTIIGAGFIGLELASALKMSLKENINVTVLQSAKVPLQHVFGEKIGQLYLSLTEKNGVKLITSAKVKEIQGKDNKPTNVVLENQNVPTDVLIVATGVKTAVQFAQKLVQKENNGIKTNVYLETEQKDVYAAGDIASYPYWYTGDRVRIEHYNQAIYQGSVAALNMVGKKFPMDNIPFFWTRSFNNSLLMTGYNKGWNEVHIVGDVSEMKFIAYYINKEDKVIGAAVMGQFNKVQIINEAMKNGVMPKGSVVKAPNFNLEGLLPEIAKKKPKCTRCTQCHI